MTGEEGEPEKLMVIEGRGTTAREGGPSGGAWMAKVLAKFSDSGGFETGRIGAVGQWACVRLSECHHSCRNAEGPTALSLAVAGTLGHNKHLDQSLDLGALLLHLGQALGVLFPGFVLLQLCSRYDPVQALHQVVGNILEGMSSCLLGVGNGCF